MRPPGASFFTSTSGSLEAAAHQDGGSCSCELTIERGSTQPQLHAGAVSVCGAASPLPVPQPAAPVANSTRRGTHLRPHGWHRMAPPYPAHPPARCRRAAAGRRHRSGWAGRRLAGMCACTWLRAAGSATAAQASTLHLPAGGSKFVPHPPPPRHLPEAWGGPCARWQWTADAGRLGTQQVLTHSG